MMDIINEPALLTKFDHLSKKFIIGLACRPHLCEFFPDRFGDRNSFYKIHGTYCKIGKYLKHVQYDPGVLPGLCYSRSF